MKKYLVACAMLSLAGCATFGVGDAVTIADTGYHLYCSTSGAGNQYCNKQYQALESDAVKAAQTAETVIADAKANGSWTQALQNNQQAIIDEALQTISDFKANRPHQSRASKGGS